MGDVVVKLLVLVVVVVKCLLVVLLCSWCLLVILEVPAVVKVVAIVELLSIPVRPPQNCKLRSSEFI